MPRGTRTFLITAVAAVAALIPRPVHLPGLWTSSRRQQLRRPSARQHPLQGENFTVASPGGWIR